MSGKSKLVLIERLLPDAVTVADGDLEVVMSDLNMMVVLGGRERTEQEYAELFRSTGLAPTRTSKAGTSGFGIFEAVQARRGTPR